MWVYLTFTLLFSCLEFIPDIFKWFFFYSQTSTFVYVVLLYLFIYQIIQLDQE